MTVLGTPFLGIEIPISGSGTHFLVRESVFIWSLTFWSGNSEYIGIESMFIPGVNVGFRSVCDQSCSQYPQKKGVFLAHSWGQFRVKIGL